MDMMMAVKPKQTFVKCLSIALFTLPVISSPLYAQEFLCDATQVSTQELPRLDQSCPIGKGLWGKQKPKGQESQFWIQCGVYSKPLSLDKAKNLYQHISKDVWLKPEGKAYRCLLGPYKDFKVASEELKKVRQEPNYKEAFLREIIKGEPVKQSKPAAKPKPVSKPKPVAEKNTAVIPAVVAPKVDAAKSPSKRNKDTEIAVRLSASIDGVEYQVPYIMFSDDQFYMEHDLPWNRMSYEQAYKTCYRQGMRLATPIEWKALLDSKVMEKDKWPMHLPYWGSQKAGLFFSGKVNQLKGSSLLNVMCVK
tara:strand:+ start:679 stop:1599 length:921 start_codon:yes stop_codon:yes gene_type:complete